MIRCGPNRFTLIDWISAEKARTVWLECLAGEHLLVSNRGCKICGLNNVEIGHEFLSCINRGSLHREIKDLALKWTEWLDRDVSKVVLNALECPIFSICIGLCQSDVVDKLKMDAVSDRIVLKGVAALIELSLPVWLKTVKSHSNYFLLI